MSKKSGAPAWSVTLLRAEKAMQAGRLDEARAGFDEAIAGARASGDLAAEMTASAGLAMVWFSSGRPAQGLAPATRAAELAHAQGLTREAALFDALGERLKQDAMNRVKSPWFTPLNQGQAALQSGEVDAAIEHLQLAVKLARSAGAQGPEATASSLLAQSFLALQRPQEAMAPAHRAMEIARALGQTTAIEAFAKLIEAATTASSRLDALATMLDSVTPETLAGEAVASARATTHSEPAGAAPTTPTAGTEAGAAPTTPTAGTDAGADADAPAGSAAAEADAAEADAPSSDAVTADAVTPDAAAADAVTPDAAAADAVTPDAAAANAVTAAEVAAAPPIALGAEGSPADDAAETGEASESAPDMPPAHDGGEPASGD